MTKKLVVVGEGAKLPFPRPPLYYVNKEDMVEGRKVGGRLRRFLLPSSSTNLSCLRGEIKFGKEGASLPSRTFISTLTSYVGSGRYPIVHTFMFLLGKVPKDTFVFT